MTCAPRRAVKFGGLGIEGHHSEDELVKSSQADRTRNIVARALGVLAGRLHFPRD